MYACMYARHENQNPNTMLNPIDQRSGLVRIIHSFSSLRHERPTVQNNEGEKEGERAIITGMGGTKTKKKREIRTARVKERIRVSKPQSIFFENYSQL